MSVPSSDPVSRSFANICFSPFADFYSYFVSAVACSALAAISVGYLCFQRPSATMLISVCFATLAALMLSAPPALAVEKPANADLNRKLKAAVTNLEYYNSLSDSDFVYDFNTITPNPFQPGSVLNADAETWPILTNGRQTVSQLNLGPCAMLQPHLHPHATNIVVAISGSTKTFMRSQNEAIDRKTTLTPGKMTIFPQASMHCMVNEGCGNNVLYSFLDSSDPGTLNIAQAFWSVGQNVGMQVLPMVQLTDNDWNKTGQRIPDIGTGSQDGFEACRKACGLS